LPASLTLLALALSAAAGPAWRVSATPRDTAESALQDAAQRDGAAGLEALDAVSKQYPQTAASGLAQLTAGLRLVESDRSADAIARLVHPDVARTGLGDYALEAVGRAQEALGQDDAAARAFLAAAAEPNSAVACSALPRAAELLLRARQAEAAASALEQVVASCPRDLPKSLLALAEARLALGDRAGAAAALDRIDRDHPGSAQAREAVAKLGSLAGQLPPRSPDEKARLLLQRGSALLSLGRAAEALEALRALSLAALPAAEADAARVALARALLSRGRSRDAVALLQKVAPASPAAAEAAFLIAKQRAAAARTPEAFEPVATGFKGTPWGEEALLSLANHYQKDARDDAALPWWRRLLAEYPEGRYAERAAWRAGWADYRAGRYEAAALTLETTARLRPASAYTPGFLYWAGRARVALGQKDRARQLLQETVQRYKFAYHGVRAREALAHLGVPAAPRPALLPDADAAEPALPEPRATRLRELLLVDRVDEAERELRLLPESSRVQATLAWLEWRNGRYRPAVVTMKRAYPEWVSEAGDRLPPEVWRILFPLRYQDELRAAADQAAVDPALVAAVILQESTFDAQALSRAGARGLMQVMPATGQRIARAKGKRFRRAALHDPVTSLDFGTHYLRQMIDQYGGSVEKVLAAYNAGPHRVDAWTAAHGELGPEEFIETIPFSETRSYVMIILSSREHYRRLYGLGRPAPGPVTEGARP